MKRLSLLSAIVLAMGLMGCIGTMLPSKYAPRQSDPFGRIPQKYVSVPGDPVGRIPQLGFNPYVPQVSGPVGYVLTATVLCFSPRSAFSAPIHSGPLSSPLPSDPGTVEITLREKDALRC